MSRVIENTLLGEAGRGTRKQRFDKMVRALSTIAVRAAQTGETWESVAAGRAQYSGYNTPARGSRKFRDLARQAIAYVQENGPIVAANYYALPNAVKDLPKHLTPVTNDIFGKPIDEDHLFFNDDRLMRNVVTASGSKRLSRPASDIVSQSTIQAPINVSSRSNLPDTAPIPMARPLTHVAPLDQSSLATKKGPGLPALAPTADASADGVFGFRPSAGLLGTNQPFGPGPNVGTAGYAYGGLVPSRMVETTRLGPPPSPREQQQAEDIASLHPAFQDRARNFLAEAKKRGLDISIVPDQGYRTAVEQDSLSGLVTGVKGGGSFHQYGLGFDVVPAGVMEAAKKPGATQEEKNWSPNDPRYGQIGALAKEMGLEWGGNFSDYDPGHLHAPGWGLSVPQSLRNMPTFDMAGNAYPSLDETSLERVADSRGRLARSLAEAGLLGLGGRPAYAAPVGRVDRAPLADFPGQRASRMRPDNLGYGVPSSSGLLGRAFDVGSRRVASAFADPIQSFTPRGINVSGPVTPAEGFARAMAFANDVSTAKADRLGPQTPMRDYGWTGGLAPGQRKSIRQQAYEANLPAAGSFPGMLAGMDALGRRFAPNAPVEDTRQQAIQEAREQARVTAYDRAKIPRTVTTTTFTPDLQPVDRAPAPLESPYQPGTYGQPNLKSPALRAIERVAPHAQPTIAAPPNSLPPARPDMRNAFPPAPAPTRMDSFKAELGPALRQALIGGLTGGLPGAAIGLIGGLLGTRTGGLLGGLAPGFDAAVPSGDRFSTGSGLGGIMSAMGGLRGATGYSRSNPGMSYTSLGPGLGGLRRSDRFGWTEVVGPGGEVRGIAYDNGGGGLLGGLSGGLGSLFGGADSAKGKGKEGKGKKGGAVGGYSGNGLY